MGNRDKEMEISRSNQNEKWEIKNILTKEKNTVDELISRRDIAKKLVNEHLDLAVETPKTAT